MHLEYLVVFLKIQNRIFSSIITLVENENQTYLKSGLILMTTQAKKKKKVCLKTVGIVTVFLTCAYILGAVLGGYF